MKESKNKYKDVAGQTLRKNHLPQWDEQHFLEFFRLVHHFCPQGEWLFNDLAFKTFCQQSDSHPLWEEWMWRFEINNEKAKVKSISGKIMAFIPSLGLFLQGNPHVISPRMREIMKANVKLAKYTEPFKIITNEIGAEIVVPNTDDGAMFTMPEVQYHNAILKLTALANALVADLTTVDMKKMSPDDRITLSLKIVNLMSRISGGQKPNIAVFKQLIINNAGRDELEKAMVAYND